VLLITRAVSTEFSTQWRRSARRTVVDFYHSDCEWKYPLYTDVGRLL